MSSEYTNSSFFILSPLFHLCHLLKLHSNWLMATTTTPTLMVDVSTFILFILHPAILYLCLGICFILRASTTTTTTTLWSIQFIFSLFTLLDFGRAVSHFDRWHTTNLLVLSCPGTILICLLCGVN